MAPQPQLSLDEMAADMAATMDLGQGKGRPIMKGGAHEMAKGGAGLGDMPGSRPGTSGAEGGFTPQAGGQVIDAGAARKGEGAPSAAELVRKAGAYTGDKTTMEPGRQGMAPYTTDKTTKEPKGEIGGGSGEGGNLNTSADDDPQHRQRKAGKVGIAGAGGGGQPGEPGLPQQSDDDSQHRQRKAGKVGISKSQLDVEIAKAQANLAALQELAKAGYTEDDEDDDEKLEKKGKPGYKKSEVDEVNADELAKALDILESVGGGATIPTSEERGAVLAKGLNEGTLTSEEMVELADLMKSNVESAGTPGAPAAENLQAPPTQAATDALVKSETEEDGEVAKSYQERWGEDPESQAAFDASPFLEHFSQLQATGLDQMQDGLQKSLAIQTSERRAFNTQLAKSLRFMADRNLHQEKLIKSLSTRLTQVEQTPLPRAGQSGAGALAKSIDGEVGAGQEMDYSTIGDTLVDMSIRLEKSESGHDLRHAMAEFEITGRIPDSLKRDVTKFRREQLQRR